VEKQLGVQYIEYTKRKTRLQGR